MMIHKISPSVYYNQWLKRLDTQFNKSTFVAKSIKRYFFSFVNLNNILAFLSRKNTSDVILKQRSKSNIRREGLVLYFGSG